MSVAPRVLLGPQRPVSNLGAAIQAMQLPAGPVAVISAGWQEAEGDVDDVRELVGRPLEDLMLYQRAETLFRDYPDWHAAYRSRQDELKTQQRLYRMRLRHLMVAARQLLRDYASKDVLAREQRHAISQLRALDRHHRRSVDTIHAKFNTLTQDMEFAALREHRAAIEATLSQCAGVVITGGNVVVLLNRMLLFGVAELLQDRPLLAWSAGAMVLSDQIVLFHDRMPEGRRDAEVLGRGLGLAPGLLILPDAERRLRHQDRTRMSLFCPRFSPRSCALLDCDSRLVVAGGRVLAADEVRTIKPNGHTGPWRKHESGAA